MRIKNLAIVSVFLCVFFLFTISSSAYVLQPYRWSTSAIYYHYAGYNSTRANSAYGRAITAWDDARADPTMLYKEGAGVYCYETQDPSRSWDGLTNYSYNANGYVISMSVVLNTTASSVVSNDNALLSVAVHEFGHVFCLGDNGTTRTIMNAYTMGTNSRYGGYGLTTPQQDDVTGVNVCF